jgi:transcriptional regulator with XRE-family HTH domain
MKTKQKSLRQLARELGVSQSYLSQIKSGKRPPSEKVISKLNGKMISKLALTLPPLTVIINRLCRVV